MALPVSPLFSRLAPAWRRRVSLWGPVALYCLLIFSLSSVSNVPQLPGGMSDKTGHMLLYSGLGFLVARALSGARSHRVTIWLAVATVLLVGLYGLTDEAHQLFVPKRQFDPRDLMADLVGAACGTAVQWLWGIIGPGSRESRAA